jgi:hypothetical protein
MLTLLAAVEVLRRNTKIYLDIRDNGYEWHEEFIAMWNVPGEGIWAISLNHDPIPLPSYWETTVKPSIDASEAKWIAIHRNRRGTDDSPDCPRPKLTQTSSSGAQLFSCRDIVPEVDWASTSSMPQDGTKSNSPSLSPRTVEDSGTPSDQEHVAPLDLSVLQEELRNVSGKLGDINPEGKEQGSGDLPDGGEKSKDVTREDEIALAGGSPESREDSVKESNEAASKHRWRRTSDEQAELDRLEVERGWLPAVEILIQLADCLLVSHVVLNCRAQLIAGCTRPFTNADCL